MPFSGHTTRSSSGSGAIVAVASRWACVTLELGTSSARVPCSPPPWTAAIVSGSASTSAPSGAIAAITTSTTIAANATTPCGRPLAPARLRATTCGTAGAGPASANPTWNTTHVSRITPPSRAMPSSGPPACEMPSVASGTPPKGNDIRTISTSVWAAGRPIVRQGPVGAKPAAAACSPANMAHVSR